MNLKLDFLRDLDFYKYKVIETKHNGVKKEHKVQKLMFTKT